MAAFNGKVVSILDDGVNTAYTVQFTYANPTTLQVELYNFVGTVVNSLSPAAKLASLVSQGVAFKTAVTTVGSAPPIALGATVTVP